MPKPNREFVGSAFVGVACLSLLLATSPMLPMGWDEGSAIHRADGIQRWFGRLAEGRREPLSKQAIESDWRYTTQIEGHPAFYGTLIAAGESLTKSWLAPLNQARFGPIALFGLAVAATTYRLWRTRSPAAAFTGAAALVTLPRLFAHAHFASFDGPLTSCWLLAWATFGSAIRVARWSVVWGVALGATMSCKFTGWLAPMPFVFWVAAFGDRRAARALAIGLPVAAGTFWALNPPLWHEPIAGLKTFFDMNLGRAECGPYVPTTYFGARYDALRPLPWHNTLVWTAITVPLGTLALFSLGLARAILSWRAEPSGLLLAAHWAVLVIIRATPWAPPHDAERLFLPSFVFLALLAGLGADLLWNWAKVGPALPEVEPSAVRKASGGRHRGEWALLRAAAPKRRPAMGHRLGRAAVVTALAGSLTSSIWYAPQWLSYYNLLVGGLRGATALGMEPTYYWDGLDAEVLAWLDEHSATDEKIAFGSSSGENWELMRRWGTLRAACLPQEPGRYRWYVIQRRPSTLSLADRRLIAHAKPAFRKTIRPVNAGWGPWRLDVPIVEVYEYAEYAKYEPGAVVPVAVPTMRK